MRISTLMNLGRSMIGWKAGIHWNQVTNEGCAWGMVNAAAPAAWPAINEKAHRIQCTLPCGCRGYVMGPGKLAASYPEGRADLSMAVVHLFNYHVMTTKDWPMDRLIDWVRSVEPPDPEEDAPKAAGANEAKPVAEEVRA